MRFSISNNCPPIPEAPWQGQVVYYPSYEYIDAIGGETTILIKQYTFMIIVPKKDQQA